MKVTLSTAGLASVIAVVALTGVACGGGSSSSGSSSSSSSSSAASSSASSSAASSSASATPADRTALLIKATDIVIPGETFTAGEPQLNPGGVDGVAVAFTNEGGTRTIGDTIAILPDAGAAKTTLEAGVAALGQSIADAAPKPTQVGTDGYVASGASPDGTKAVTVVTFTQGAAYVVLEFDSAAGDAVPEDFAISLAQKQADLIKSGLG